ncbi:hypothetical protein HY486_01725 [Candidatus Woesearchaeota archaeon]|nr:hypothetical protein [Candidatus Woesearchaeota archaeon]
MKVPEYLLIASVGVGIPTCLAEPAQERTSGFLKTLESHLKEQDRKNNAQGNTDITKTMQEEVQKRKEQIPPLPQNNTRQTDLSSRLITPSIASSQTAIIIIDWSDMIRQQPGYMGVAMPAIQDALRNPQFRDYHIFAGHTEGTIQYMMPFEKDENAADRVKRWNKAIGRYSRTLMISQRPYLWLEQGLRVAKSLQSPEIFLITGNTAMPSDLFDFAVECNKQSYAWKKDFEKTNRHPPELFSEIPINIIQARHIRKDEMEWQKQQFEEIARTTKGKYVQVVTTNSERNAK